MCGGVGRRSIRQPTPGLPGGRFRGLGSWQRCCRKPASRSGRPSRPQRWEGRQEPQRPPRQTWQGQSQAGQRQGHVTGRCPTALHPLSGGCRRYRGASITPAIKSRIATNAITRAIKMYAGGRRRPRWSLRLTSLGSWPLAAGQAAHQLRRRRCPGWCPRDRAWTGSSPLGVGRVTSWRDSGGRIRPAGIMRTLQASPRRPQSVQAAPPPHSWRPALAVADVP